MARISADGALQHEWVKRFQAKDLSHAQLGGITRSHLETLVLCKLDFDQNNYTFPSILLIKIALCSKYLSTKFVKNKCCHMSSPAPPCLPLSDHKVSSHCPLR